jgi:uncharacterized protein DUF6869
MNYTNQELVDGYIENYKDQTDKTFWAFEEVLKIVSTDLTRGFEITSALIESSEDELTLSYIAAGPLEDLLIFHGLNAVPLVDEAARKSIKFRAALKGVWISGEGKVGDEFDKLLKKYCSN